MHSQNLYDDSEVLLKGHTVIEVSSGCYAIDY
jgi:hypothetical protein